MSGCPTVEDGAVAARRVLVGELAAALGIPRETDWDCLIRLVRILAGAEHREVSGDEAGKLPFGSVVVRVDRHGNVSALPVIVGDGIGERSRSFAPGSHFRLLYRPASTGTDED